MDLYLCNWTLICNFIKEVKVKGSNYRFNITIKDKVTSNPSNPRETLIILNKVEVKATVEL